MVGEKGGKRRGRKRGQRRETSGGGRGSWYAGELVKTRLLWIIKEGYEKRRAIERGGEGDW